MFTRPVKLMVELRTLICAGKPFWQPAGAVQSVHFGPSLHRRSEPRSDPRLGSGNLPVMAEMLRIRQAMRIDNM